MGIVDLETIRRAIPGLDLALVALAAAAPSLTVALAVWCGRRKSGRAERDTQPEKMLRSPGHSLEVELDSLLRAALTDLVVASLLCFLTGVFIGWTRLITETDVPRWLAFIPAALGLPPAIVGVLFIRRILRRLRRIRTARQEIRGEQAVAELLHQVGDAGYRVFHDLPTETNGNIAHVAVGPPGVFLIQTCRRRHHPVLSGRRPDVAQVRHKTIYFPNGSDIDTIPHAEWSAQWLAAYLQRNLGKRVPVEPLVVLPGWSVEHFDLALPNGLRPAKRRKTVRSTPVTAVSSNATVLNALGLDEHLRRQRRKFKATQIGKLIPLLEEKAKC